MNLQIVNRPFFFLLLTFILGSYGGAAQWYPSPSCVMFSAMSLTICPPDSLPDPPVQLMSYNIYVDDEFVDNIPISPPFDTVSYLFDESQLIPGVRSFCVKAVYSDWISEATCDTSTVIFGYHLPFYEDWSSGSLDTHKWETGNPQWVINYSHGNPAPCVEFSTEQLNGPYWSELSGFYLNVDTLSIGEVFLEFDVSLNSIHSTGLEKLKWEVWDWYSNNWFGSDSWEISNENGSLENFHIRKRLFSLSSHYIFRFRFVTNGNNPSDILHWKIDNIHIQRECRKPTRLESKVLPDESIRLTWLDIYNFYFWYWMFYHDGAYSGNSVGTGGKVEFDVAAKWPPSTFFGWDNPHISAVDFVPNEMDAEYTIKIWQGDSAQNLVYEQPVHYPVIGEVNFEYLYRSVLIDTSEWLWIGYHVNANTGYPAGTDGGPANNGLGNMMYFEDTWQTLLQINPELDYNWYISGYLGAPNPEVGWVNIYRQENFQGEYIFLDSTQHQYMYKDETAIPGHSYCYKAEAIYVNSGDTCYSDFSNDTCVIITSTPESAELFDNLRIFPNPTHSVLNVQSESGKIIRISLFNSLGMLMLEKEPASTTTILQVDRFVPGLYFLSIHLSDGIRTRKVIIN